MHDTQTMEELIIHNLNWPGQRHVENRIMVLFVKTVNFWKLFNFFHKKLHHRVLNQRLALCFSRTLAILFVKTGTNVSSNFPSQRSTLVQYVKATHNITKILWKTVKIVSGKIFRYCWNVKIVSGKILDIAEMKITSLIFDF